MAEAKKIEEMSYRELQTEYERINGFIQAAIDPTIGRTIIIPPDAHAYYGRRAELSEHIASYEAGSRYGAGAQQPGDQPGRYPERFEQGRQAAVSGAHADVTLPPNTNQTLDDDLRHGADRKMAHAILEYDRRSPSERQNLDRMLDSKSASLQHEGIVPASMSLVAAAIDIRATEAVVKHYGAAVDTSAGRDRGASASMSA
jgi:hypothetical protein